MGTADTHILSSGSLKVIVSAHGAELHSVSDPSGTEYLWQAGEAWPRHAPLLFPIVGRLKNDLYRYNGREYAMSQHGFARDRTFSLKEGGQDKVVYELEADAQTLKAYPFDFLLRVIYTLSGRTLVCTYEVLNQGSGTMYFSIGAHPGFRVPLGKNERFTDYYIELERYTVMQSALTGGLRSGETKILPLDGKKIRLTPTLFDSDALVFENTQVGRARLASERSAHAIEMTCEGWPFFGIWSKKGNQEFVCLEPWQGIADAVDSEQELTRKKGIKALEPGASFSCSFSTSFR